MTFFFHMLFVTEGANRLARFKDGKGCKQKKVLDVKLQCIWVNTFSENMNRIVLHKPIHKWIKGPAKRNEQYDS